MKEIFMKEALNNIAKDWDIHAIKMNDEVFL